MLSVCEQTHYFFKFVRIFLVCMLLATSMPIKTSRANIVNMTSMVGMRFHPDQPLKFSFFFDQLPITSQQETQQEAKRLIQYFLAGLAIPEKDLWVNLSAYESDRVIPIGLGFTQAGQDMLQQDYVLKQIASQLTHPDTSLGKSFWQKVYDKAQQQLGTVDIPIDVFNKVWILPERSVVYQDGEQAVLGEIRFKVMMEADYLALMKERQAENILNEQSDKTLEVIDHMVQNVTKEIIIPVLEKEVNESAQFLVLRQIFQALVLSSWFKDHLKEHAVSKVYSNQQKILGIADTTQQEVDDIYQQYLKAYQVGAYDLIKEDGPFSEEGSPRRYFSGGVLGEQISQTRTDVDVSDARKHLSNASQIVDIDLKPIYEEKKEDDSAQKMMTTRYSTETVQSGIQQLFSIGKITPNPKHRKVLDILMSLDFLVELLDEVYPQESIWYRPLFAKKTPRQAIKALIQDIYTDFLQHQQNQEYDIDSSILKLLKKYEEENLFPATQMGDQTLADIIRMTILIPYEIPIIPGLSDERIQQLRDHQYGKFSRIYEFIIEEFIKKAGPSSQDICEMYKMMLDSTRKQLLKGRFIQETIFDTLKEGQEVFGQLKKAKVIIQVSSNKYILSPNFLRMKESFLKNNPAFGSWIEEIWSFLDHHAYVHENYTSEGYVHLMMEHFEFLMQIMMKKIADGEANDITYKNLESYTDQLSILEEMADSLMGDWNWHTAELRGIVYNLTRKKLEKAEKDTLSFRHRIEEYTDGTSNVFFKSQGTLIVKYLDKVTEIIQELLKDPTNDREKKMKGYKYLILQQAIEDVLSSESVEIKEQYMPLLTEIGRLIIRNAELELPSVEEIASDVNIVIDYLLTPTQYEQIRDYFEGKLKNIIFVGVMGGLTAHFALLAKADNVGVIMVNEQENMAQLKSMTPGQRMVVWQEGSETFMQTLEPEETINATNKIPFKQKIFSFLSEKNPFKEKMSSLPYILANADTSSAIKKAIDKGAKAIGLVRTENSLRNAIPSRSFWKDMFRKISQSAGNHKAVIRAIDIQDDKKPLMLSHLKIPRGQRFYFENSVGIEVFKEQIRALIDVRQEGAENLRFEFPMINNLEDWKKIQEIIRDVLNETEFSHLSGIFPIDLGVMIETQEAFDQFDTLLQEPRIKFFSVGTNDLTSKVYGINRLDPKAGEYFERVNPRIVKMIIEMAKKIKDYTDVLNSKLEGVFQVPTKEILVCGDLASKEHFWFIRHMLRRYHGLKVDLSMPSSLIPVFYGAYALLEEEYERIQKKNIIFEENYFYLKLKRIVDRIVGDSQPIQDVDQKYVPMLSESLTEVSSVIEKKFADMLTQQQDPAHLEQRKHGGIDLRAFTESIEHVERSSFVEVTSSYGDVQTIGGPYFQGFSFEITRINIGDGHLF